MVTIKTTVEVTQESIMYQFCAAFEGGSSEWLHSAYWRGDKKPDEDHIWYADESIYDVGLKIDLEYDNPDDESEELTTRITYDDIELGLEIMANRHSRHFADMIGDNADATTADVFIQCVLFKDVIYG